MRRPILVALVLCATSGAYASPPDELGVLRVLGARASSFVAPISGKATALVAIPSGVRASDLGVTEIAPGIGRVRGTPTELIAFGAAHPTVHVEVAPPAHAL